MDPTSNRADGANGVDSKALYRDLSMFLKDHYFPHYNIYQKSMIEEKLKCHEKAQSDPAKYFSCVETVDQQMKDNSNILQQRFGQVDINDRMCQENCKNSFEVGSKFHQECMMKCAKTMKDQCINTYNKFYDQVIGKNPEYKNLKK